MSLPVLCAMPLITSARWMLAAVQIAYCLVCDIKKGLLLVGVVWAVAVPLFLLPLRRR